MNDIYYQYICVNGHYTQCNVLRDKCIDCYQQIILTNKVKDNIYLHIPFQKNGNITQKVDVNKMKKLISNKDKLIIPDKVKELPLQKIAQLFQYFDKDKTLRIQFELRNDAGNQKVPYVIATFGEYKNQNWQTFYIEDYECFQMCYDGDIKYIVVQLYTNIWNKYFRKQEY